MPWYEHGIEHAAFNRMQGEGGGRDLDWKQHTQPEKEGVRPYVDRNKYQYSTILVRQLAQREQ